jgi:hypothetical protein
MTPRKLVLSEIAISDIARRGRMLRQHRDSAFARAWTASFLSWLRGRAESGAQLGSQHPHDQNFRTFGYKRQATLLVEYTQDEMRVVRVYFAGQDWTTGR